MQSSILVSANQMLVHVYIFVIVTASNVSYVFYFCRPSKEERFFFAMDESENAINSIASSIIHNLDVSPTMMTFSIIYVIIIIIVSLLGNIIVCVVVLSTRSLRQSINSCFILSLAVSDLVITCLVMPFDVELIISFERWRHGEIMCNVWTTKYLIAVPTSILSLLALTVYRYRLLLLSTSTRHRR